MHCCLATLLDRRIQLQIEVASHILAKQRNYTDMRHFILLRLFLGHHVSTEKGILREWLWDSGWVRVGVGVWNLGWWSFSARFGVRHEEGLGFGVNGLGSDVSEEGFMFGV